jgi:TonB family protein
MKQAFVIASWSIACISNAHAQSELSEPPALARPITVVAPAFPRDATARPSGTRVDVVGTVMVNGEFKSDSIVAEDSDQRFADAVADVLRWWRFVPAADKLKCAPMEVRSNFSIWFEGSDKAPKVFVSFPPVPAASKQKSPMRASIQAGKVPFVPKKLLNMEGQVEVLYLIAPNGDIKSIKVLSSTPSGAFDSLALEAASKTRLVWSAPGPTEDVCAGQTYTFCVDRDVALPFSGCTHK